MREEAEDVEGWVREARVREVEVELGEVGYCVCEEGGG